MSSNSTTTTSSNGKNHLTDTPLQRTVYLDYLRVFATLAVIILHVAAQHWSVVDVASLDWQAFNFYDSIVRWTVPVFVMISGSLFIENKKHTIKRLYSKTILRIVTAFIFWSACYTVVESINYEMNFESAIACFLTGHYHMWFLFMIVGLYIITPFLHKLVENPTLVKYFLWISLIFAFIFPLINDLAYRFSTPIGNSIKAMLDNTSAQFVLGYTFYYVLGLYLSKTELSKRTRTIIYVIGLTGFLITIFASAHDSLLMQAANGKWYGNFNINVLFESVAVFVFFKYCKALQSSTDILYKLVSKLSKYSFGVYLIHAMVLEGLYSLFNLHTLSFNAFLSVPVVTVLVFIISVIISGIINHIPILKHYIV